MARPGFKPGWGRQPFPGRSDSRCLPPFLRSLHPASWIVARLGICVRPRLPVGASLLAKRPCQSTSMLDVSSHSRAGSLPHWIFTGHGICVRPRLPVGLPAMASVMLNGTGAQQGQIFDEIVQPVQTRPAEGRVDQKPKQKQSLSKSEAVYRGYSAGLGVPLNALESRASSAVCLMFRDTYP